LPPKWNLTDIALGVTAAGFAVAIFRYQLFQIVPVGRQRVIETMSDPFVILDAEGKVVDSNPAARRLCEVGPRWRGMPVGEFLSSFSENIALLQDTDGTVREVRVERNGNRRDFDLNVSLLTGPGDSVRGRVLVFREVTRLKDRERRLNLMRKVQSRVLRHNLRNAMQPIRSSINVLATQVDGQEAKLATDATERIDDLLALSKKTRTLERLIEEDQEPAVIALCAELENLVAAHQREFSDVSFTHECPSPCEVEVIPALVLAFDNLIENACQHNDAERPTVDLTVTEHDDAVTVTVTDNGPGIPEQELRVLDSGDETPLEHGSSIGLWIVQWVIGHSRATIEYQTGGDGTTVTVRIPRQSASGT
jgi:signal transduction histidine kinase